MHDEVMATGTLAFPFAITAQGTAAVVGYATDESVDQTIAVLTLTQIGERPLQPGYGIPDPAFTGLSAGDIQVGLDDYGTTGISVDEIVLEPVSDTQSVADIRWSYTDDEGFQA